MIANCILIVKTRNSRRIVGYISRATMTFTFMFEIPIWQLTSFSLGRKDT